MPEPKTGESRQNFISRCMDEIDDEEEFEDAEQDEKLKHCYNLWNEEKGGESNNE